MEIYYPSKIDWWICSALIISATISGAGLASIAFDYRAWLLPIALLLLLCGVFLPLWILFGTGYTFEADSLLIRSGPFKWEIDYKNITSVETSNTLVSSPALSRERLLIRYGRYNSILISPIKQENFLADLYQRSPQAEP